MTTQLLREETAASGDAPMPSKPGGSVGKGIVWGLLGCAVTAFVIVVAHNARYGAVAERIKNPNVQGAPRAGATTLRVDPLGDGAPDRHRRVPRADRRGLRRHVAIAAEAPGPAHGHRLHDACLAGPDHELGSVCGVQPAALALARDLAAGLALADRRAVCRTRLRNVLPGAVFRRDLRIAAPPAEAARSTRSSGGTRSSAWRS